MALKVMVAAWPVLILVASASAKPATTSRLDTLDRVRNVRRGTRRPRTGDPIPTTPTRTAPEPEPAPALVAPEPDDPEPVDPDPDELDDAALLPPPLTVWPTAPLRTVTVPANGAVSVVSETVF